MDANSTAADFMRKVKSVVNQLAEHGERPSEEMIIERVLNALPCRYEHVMRGISSTNRLPSLEELIGVLQLEDDREKNRNQENEITGLMAQLQNTMLRRGNLKSDKPGSYIPPHVRSGSSSYRDSGSKDRRNGQRKPDTRSSEEKSMRCERCGKPGHLAPKWRRMDYRRIKPCSAGLGKVRTIGSNTIVVSASGTPHEIEGVTDVLINLNGVAQTLTDVLYVPTMKKNLISIGQLADMGYLIIFYVSKCVVVSKSNLRKTIATGYRMSHNGLYRLTSFHADNPHETTMIPNPTTQLDSGSPPAALLTCSIEGSLSAAELWHNRLGHPSYESLHYMSTRKTATGLPDIPKTTNICTGCMAGKQMREPFPDHSETRATSILQLLHADLCGPFPVPSMGGARYVFTIVDNFSHKGWSILLKFKSDNLQKFIEFQKQVETATGKRISCLRTDRGGEFLSNKFIDHCKKTGIGRQLTTARTPQQNGIAERRNRIERAHAKFDAGIKFP
ncbi:hypothetical protein R1sor_008591 [Riccia sorocarpa]|uniref:Integrase catalytic domain-containing protein n=1 Tax=Riccia sorocarpa TaxID=122646 RepID=A0ABD3HXW0_9MARC